MSKPHELEFFQKTVFGPVPLGIDSVIMGLLKSRGFISIVDDLLPKVSNNSGLSSGELCALTMTKLASTEPCALSKLPQYAATVPMASWLERQDVDPTMFNRYAVGDMLDRIAEFGSSRFYSSCAVKLIGETELQNIRVANIDSTSYHFHGNYKAWDPKLDPATVRKMEEYAEYWAEDQVKVEIKHGYSRDNRPQDRQINHILAMIRSSNSSVALPVFQQVISGNINDLSSFAGFAEDSLPKIKNYVPNLCYMVGDCAAATFNTAYFCKQMKVDLITRLPDSLAAVKRVFAKADEGNVTWQTFELKAATEHKPAETIMLADVGSYAFANRKDKSMLPVEGKMFLVHAESMRELKTATVMRRANKEKEHIQTKLSAIAAACEKDVHKDVAAIKKSAKFCSIGDAYTIQSRAKYGKRGRPGHSAVPEEIELYVEDYEVELNTKAIEQAIEHELKYVLWCGDLNLAPQQVYLYYHQQADVENGWRSLKDPLCFADSFYLKSAKRIVALCTLLSLALLVQRIVLNAFRAYLKSSGQAVPRASHNRPTQSPAWSTLVDGFTLTGFSFNCEQHRVEVALPDSFAVGFILQADPEIKKMFDASHINLYIESIQRGYHKFLAKQAELASNISVLWKSPIHNAEVRELK